MKLATKLIMSATLIPSLASIALAKEIKTNTAQMQAMDKITGRVKVIEVPVNGNVNFGTFSILVRDCQTRPPEETPENYAFVDILDNNTDGTKANIFRGWMLSSTPALNAVEHPIYDVWLLKCIDTNVDTTILLSKEQLDERNSITKTAEEGPVKGQPVNLLANIEEEAKSLLEAKDETPTNNNIISEVSETPTEVVFEPIENNVPTVVGENIEFKEAIEDVEQSGEEAVKKFPTSTTETQALITTPVADTEASIAVETPISQQEGPVNLLNLPEEEKAPTIETSATPSTDNDKFIVKGLVPDNMAENTEAIFENEAPNVRIIEESFPLELIEKPTAPKEENLDFQEENPEKQLEVIVDDLLKNNENINIEQINQSPTPPTKEDNPEFDLIY